MLAAAGPALGRWPWPDAVIVCGRSGTRKRSSRGNCERSGGTSSGCRVFAVSYCTLSDVKMLPVHEQPASDATTRTAVKDAALRALFDRLMFQLLQRTPASCFL